jgi:hypothetical protein
MTNHEREEGMTSDVVRVSDRKRILFGGWQTRVIHEGASVTTEIHLPFSHCVGGRAARNIVNELARHYGDGTYIVDRYNPRDNPRRRQVCRVKVRGGAVTT